MKMYHVHISGTFGYGIDVEAESEKEAISIAEEKFDYAIQDDYDLFPRYTEILEEREIEN